MLFIKKRRVHIEAFWCHTDDWVGCSSTYIVHMMSLHRRNPWSHFCSLLALTGITGVKKASN